MSDLPELMKANDDYGEFQIFDYVSQNDGYGGMYFTYKAGAIFDAVLILNNSIQAQTAQKQGVTGVYTLTFSKTLRLPWHTVFQKIIRNGNEIIGTGSYYRVTTKDDNSPPKTASLKFRQVVCEEYKLPDEHETTGGNTNGNT